MRTYRATISTLTLMMLVLTAGAPATASAGSLLSGYGGPGQGSQSILGTALLGAPSGGASGGGGSAGGQGTSTSTTSTSAVPTGVGGAKTPVHTSRSTRRSGSSPGTAGKSSGKPSLGDTGAYAQTSSQASVGGSPTLGLSGADIRDVLLALAALAMTGALTVQLARRAG
jgi:hypothetical protein